MADGGSDDGTRAAPAALAGADAAPAAWSTTRARIVAAGLNRALGRGAGRASSCAWTCTRATPPTTWRNAWPRCSAAAPTTWAGPGAPKGRAAGGRAIAAAFQSRWVAGGARSRDLDYEGEVDTVYLGCWPRASFERFGGFDETLVRNQDDEHNLRIVRGGGRVWQSAAIRSTYRPRDSLSALWRQWLQYGYWKPFVMRKHGQAAALRHLRAGLRSSPRWAGWRWRRWPASAWPLLLLAAAYALLVAGAVGGGGRRLVMAAAVARCRRWWRRSTWATASARCSATGTPGATAAAASALRA